MISIRNKAHIGGDPYRVAMGYNMPLQCLALHTIFKVQGVQVECLIRGPFHKWRSALRAAFLKRTQGWFPYVEGRKIQSTIKVVW